jgi:hypothetical protein
MRMAKSFGLALIALALLVSFTGSAMAVWPEPADSDKINVNLAYSDGTISAQTKYFRIDLAATSDDAYDNSGTELILPITATSLSVDIRSNDGALTGTQKSILLSDSRYALVLSTDYGAAVSFDVLADTNGAIPITNLAYPGKKFLAVVGAAENDKVGYAGFTVRTAYDIAALNSFVISSDENTALNGGNVKIILTGGDAAGTTTDPRTALAEGAYVEGLDEEDFASDKFGKVTHVELFSSEPGAEQYLVTAQSETEGVLAGSSKINSAGELVYILSFGELPPPPPPADVVTPADYEFQAYVGSKPSTIAKVDSTTYKVVDVEYEAGFNPVFTPLTAEVEEAADIDFTDNGITAKTYTLTITTTAGAAEYTLTFKDGTPPVVPTNPTDLKVILHPGTAYADIEYEDGVYFVDADYSADAKFYFNGTVYDAVKNDANKTWSVTIGGTTYTIWFNDSIITPGHGGSSSGGGCDAGLGALGLMVLAGSAMVLRRKK